MMGELWLNITRQLFHISSSSDSYGSGRRHFTSAFFIPSLTDTVLFFAADGVPKVATGILFFFPVSSLQSVVFVFFLLLGNRF